jgi:hypothetical protein
MVQIDALVQFQDEMDSVAQAAAAIEITARLARWKASVMRLE